MNKRLYRIIFNKRRGILMAVAETAVSDGKEAGTTGLLGRVSTHRYWATLRSCYLGVLSAFGLLVISASPTIAQVVADPSAPKALQPTILTSSNGTPQVNIQTPSAAGVSRNVYSQFDVNQQGVILNNARNNAQTQIGGWVQANPWLAAGSARVILNEVNSSNPSQLKGYVEVAGDRAQVVIANPAGITCDGCGFLNANRATLTTGDVLLSGGTITGYRTSQGEIAIQGAGMDASRVDYTDIIARSVKVNAGLWANNLRINAGASETSADLSQTKPIATSGGTPLYGIDVASLGGMYAGKIALVGTEHGLGVRNAGTIAAAVGDVIVTADGRLENSGSMISLGAMTLRTGDIDNTGGYVGTNGNLNADATSIKNTQGGVFLSQQRIDIATPSLDNKGGTIQALGDINIDGKTGTVDNTSSLIRSASTLHIQAANILNQQTLGTDQGLEGNAVVLVGDNIDNRSGAIRTSAALSISSAGTVDNSQGLISAGQAASLLDRDLTNKTLSVRNTAGTLIAGTAFGIDVANLGGDGSILSLGDLNIKLPGAFTNTGSVLANGKLSLDIGNALTNRAALKAGNELSVVASDIDNAATGEISALTTKLEAQATLTNRGLIDGASTLLLASTITNLGTGRLYGDNLAISAATLNNDVENGSSGTIAARNRLDIGVQTVNNREHALIFSSGDMYIGGALDANSHAINRAGTVNNSSATIEASGNLDLAAAQLNNTNAHFSTQIQQIGGSAYVVEYQGSGSPYRYVSGTPGVFVYNDESDHLMTPQGSYESWVRYEYYRTIQESVVTQSDPAKIIAGGNINLTGDTVINDKSQIIAGGLLSATVGTLQNTEVTGTRIVTDTGTVTSFWRNHEKGRDSTGSSSSGYYPAARISDISLTPTVYQANAAVLGSTVNLGLVSVANTSGSGLATAAAVANTDLSHLSSLFHASPNATAGYFIETDPQFASYRTWLSSDYMLQQLSIDPATTQKRLGDGFYEQKLIREQVAQLTGRRFLDGYADDEAQYQALLDNAVTLAKTLGLRPGVALTSEQMAQLTSDIVWLVEKTVTLPDGTKVQALVPQVYVRVKEGDLDNSGALLAGASVKLNLTGDLLNSGKIAGRDVVTINADSLRNLGGRIAADQMDLQARTDLDNIGGTIQAQSTLLASAGRDLNVTTTTHSNDGPQGSVTNISRIAGLYVTGADGGTLRASAGRDVNLTAAQVGNASTDGTTRITADRNLNLGTVTEASSQSITWDDKNWRKDSSRQDVGTTIVGNGNITLDAGGDLNARAAQITSGSGIITATAKGNINLTAGESSFSLEEAHQHSSKGFLSKKTITTRDTLEETRAIGTTISGEMVNIKADKDLTLTGSSVVSTLGTKLEAGNNLTIEAARESRSESHFRDEKKSGIFSSGGVGFTVGSQQQSVDSRSTASLAAASTVGSVEGNVTLTAGNAYRQIGSDVVTPQGNIDITAKQVNIEEARETLKTTTETRFKQSGLTVAITNPVISAIQTGQQMADAAGKTGDSRLQALAAASTALAAKNAYDAVGGGQNVKDGNLADKAGGIGVSISLGSSKSQSTTTQYSDTGVASHLTAGGDITIKAKGAGKDSDLTIQGSQVLAGGNVTLSADDEIKLLAGRNESSQNSQNSSSSGSIGVGFNLGAGGAGFSVNVSASKGKGSSNGSDTQWDETLIQAGKKIDLKSGGDTTLKGAIVEGKQIVADIGGNLTIESLQDQSTYDSKQSNSGFSISVPITGGSLGGNVSAGKSKIDSNYQSVVEQSGFKAGDEGFQVTVKGDTDLKGAVIASTDKAVEDGKNTFKTDGTLTLASLDNQASYQGKATGINLGAGVSTDGKLAPGGTSAGTGKEEGSASSTTQSGISGITGNKDMRSGDGSNGIDKIFDAKKVQESIDPQVKITQMFGQQASKAIGDYAETKMKESQALREQASREPNQERAKELNRQADELESQWGAQGSLRLAAHTLVGGLTGGSGGAGGAAAGTLTAPLVAEALNEAGITGSLASTLTAIASTAAGAVVGGSSGAGTALNEVTNNYLSHAENEARLKEARACANGDKNACATRDAWDDLDKERDAKLRAACFSNGSSAECSARYADMTVALNSYSGKTTDPQTAKDRAIGLDQYTADSERASFKPLVNVPHYDAGAIAKATDALKFIGNLAIDLTPVVGDAKAFAEADTRLDYALAVIGALGPVGDGAKVLIKEAKALLEAGDAAKAIEKITDAKAQLHHICTDKNCISSLSGGPWTPEFQKMFDKAGLTLQNDLNKVLVVGHQGPHPQEYHEAVYNRLNDLNGLSGEAYKNAFKEELSIIAKEIQTPGTYLNRLVTKQ